MSTIPRELQNRGHSVDLYVSHSDFQDPVGRELPPKYHGSILAYAFSIAQWKYQRKKTRYDLILNNLYPNPTTPRSPFKGPSIINWQGCEVHLATITQPGYYVTPDIKAFLPNGSMLLPRAVNPTHFHWNREPRDRKDPNHIRIGHFWKRDNVCNAYLNKYWKKTDLLLDAIKLLEHLGYEIELVEQSPRSKMPETLASLDVLAEEFGYLSHGITAIESLMIGTPVVGSYNPDLCEYPAVLDHVFNVEPEPRRIAEGILDAIDHDVGDIENITKFFSAKHTVDVLEDTWETLVEARP